MGLDMFVFRVTKQQLDSGTVYDRSDLSGVIIDESDMDAPAYRQILPYCAKVRVINHYYDMEKLAAEYGITNAYIGGYGFTQSEAKIILCGKKDGNPFNEIIPAKLIESRYVIDREETCFVCGSEEIRYWRKEYDVQDWFYDHISEQIENTGYYTLSEETILQFNKAFPDDALPVEPPDEESALVYYEWY